MSAILNTTMAEADARLGRRTVLPSGTGDILERLWAAIDASVADTLVTTARGVTYYTNPQADGQTYTGTYWNCDTHADENSEDGTRDVTIKQKLVKVVNTTAEADAILVKRTVDPSTGKDVITRAWPFIDQTAADTLLTTLLGVGSYTNPQADAQTLTGTYINSESSSYKDGDNKGVVIIGQMLTKVTTVTALGDLPTPVKDAGKETLKAFSIQEGLNEYIVHKYYYINPSNRAVCLGLSPTESGYTIVSRKFEVDAEDKTALFQVLFRKVTWSNTTPTYVTVAVENIQGYGKQATKVAFGVPIANAEAIVEALTAAGITDAKWTDSGDGEAAITYTNHTGSVLAVTTEYYAATGNQNLAAKKTWYGVAPADRTTTMTTARAYTGDEEGDYSGLTHKWERLSVGTDGYATIEAMAWNPDAAGTGVSWSTGSWTEETVKTRTNPDDRTAVQKITFTWAFTAGFTSSHGAACSAVAANAYHVYVPNRPVIANLWYYKYATLTSISATWVDVT